MGDWCVWSGVSCKPSLREPTLAKEKHSPDRAKRKKRDYRSWKSGLFVLWGRSGRNQQRDKVGFVGFKWSRNNKATNRIRAVFLLLFLLKYVERIEANTALENNGVGWGGGSSNYRRSSLNKIKSIKYWSNPYTNLLFVFYQVLAQYPNIVQEGWGLASEHTH